MNDLSTSEPSRPQFTWSSMPWKVFIFMYLVFLYSTPLFHFDQFQFNTFGLDDASGINEIMQKDNWMRIAALLALGSFSLFKLMKFESGRFRINGLLGYLLIFYLIWTILSLTWSVDPRFTLKRVMILQLMASGALYAAYRFSLQEVKALIFFICGVSVITGIVVGLLTNNFFPWQGWWRFGNNMHPIVQGWHVGLLFLSCLALAKTNERNRGVYIIIAIIAFLLLILTRSRMPFLSCMIAAALYMGLVSENYFQGFLLFLFIVAVGCLMYLYLGSEFMSYSEEIVTLGRTEEYQTVKTLTGRLPLWRAVTELINKRPFVGYGYNSFLTGENLVWVANTAGWATNSPHSGYIETMGGLGYTGFIAMVLILILAAAMSIRLTKRNLDYALVAAVIVWLMFNLYTEDNVLTRPFFPVFIWMTFLARMGFIRKESL